MIVPRALMCLSKTIDNGPRLLAEPLEYQPSLLANSECRFIDRYNSGNLYICLVGPFRDEAKPGFIIGADLSVDRDDIKTPTHNAETRNLRLDGQKTPVFPFNIEVVKKPKVVIPSLVRAQEFEPLLFGSRKAFYEFTPLKALARGEDGRASRDRKVNLVKIGDAVARCYGASQHVKSASDGVNISSELGRIGKREGLPLDGDNQIVGRIVFQLNDFWINILIDPVFHSFLEGWQLGIGPIEGRDGKRELANHGYLS